MDSLNDECNNIKQSFQDGCNIIINKIQSIGVTPSSNSPTAIANAIQEIRDGSLEAGRQQVTGNPNNYNLFTAEQYNQNYNNGRTQGQNDVKNNPNGYGLYTQQQYTQNYNNGRTQGQNDVKNNPNNYGLYNKTQYDNHYNEGYNAGVRAGQGSVAGSYRLDFRINAHDENVNQWIRYRDQITLDIKSNGTASLGSPSFMNAQIRPEQGEYCNINKV